MPHLQLSRRQAFDLLEEETKRELAKTVIELNSLREEAAAVLAKQDKLIDTLEIITLLRSKK